ncbi:MAG TPA: hypothetical protein VGM50_05655 [Gemmatimonadaceae bacterium]|jgi:protein TonB
MMRFWFDSYIVRVTLIGATAISIVVHAVLITTWVFETLPSAGLDEHSIANHVFYIPPPDRVPTEPGSRAAMKFIVGAPEGDGTGKGARQMGDERPTVAAPAGDQAKDSIQASPIPATTGPDSVYSILEVDSAVVRLAKSAAPAYPLKLLQQHVMGFVNARYVVDTTGFADTTSFTILEATNPEFITAVREALPYMRFSPAKIGSTKVRQLVEQQFKFRIADPDTTLPPLPPKKKP